MPKLNEKIRKVGRPPILDQPQLEFLRGLYPEIRSRRGLTNKYYEIRAFGALKDLPSMEFLRDLVNHRMKCSVLQQLGRLPRREDIKTVAEHICQRARNESLTVKQWENVCIWIRHMGELI